MLSDNNYHEATAAKVRSFFEGKAYDKLLGRWVNDPASGEVVLIRSVVLAGDHFMEPQIELSLLTAKKVADLIARREDMFAEPGITYKISSVSDSGIKAINDNTVVELNFCEPPVTLTHVRLSDDMRAFLEPGILGTMRTHEMELTALWGRPFVGSYKNHLNPITALYLSEFDGERFSLQVVTAVTYSDTPTVYDIASRDGYTKSDIGTPERAPGRVLPLRHPSQDV